MIRVWRRDRSGNQPTNDGQTNAAAAPDPDHAWKALSLVNEWIRHSDTKAGVTLAFVGALATMLFNLTRDSPLHNCVFNVSVIVACCLLLATAVFCGMTLTPRLDDRDADPEAINRLFYQSITREFSGNRMGYVSVLSALTSNAQELVADLADQIHANARIATVKSAHAKWAIRLAFSAGAMVGLVALLIGIDSIS